MLNREITLDYLLKAVRRRKLAIVLPATIITSAVMLIALLLPNIYQADTVILVEPQQSVETAGGKPSITVRMEHSRLSTLSQQILSRSNIEQIINEFGLYGKLPMEERVKRMREDIKLDVVRQDLTGNVGAFKISFEYGDPRIASEVTNRLSGLFIDQNVTSREKFYQERAQFLDEQTKQLKAKLDESEQKLQQFKQMNFDKLPEHRDTNLRTIEELNRQISANNDALNRAQQQKIYIETMLAQYKVAPRSVRTSPRSDLPLVRVPTALEKQLDELKTELVTLQNRYTEQHPDVIRTKRRVSELEHKKAVEEASMTASVNNKTEKSSDPEPTEVSPESFTAVAQLTSQLRSVKAEISERYSETGRLQNQLGVYQSRLGLTPELENQLAILTREHEVAKSNFENVANEKLTSQMAQELEEKQKTMLFKVVDPAKQPEKPGKPNRPAIVLFGLLAGLSAGVGLAFYREFTDESLRTEKDVETTLGLEVLAAIPQANQS